jgi:hypothetical protein
MSDPLHDSVVSGEPPLYYETSRDPTVRRRARDAVLGGVVHAVVGLLTVGFGLLWSGASLVVGSGLAVLGFAYFAIAARQVRRGLSFPIHEVSLLEIVGPEFPEGRLQTKLVARISSTRTHPRSGRILIHTTDGRTIRIEAYWLASSDAFWEALKVVCPRSSGFEWVNGIRVQRPLLADGIQQG